MGKTGGNVRASDGMGHFVRPSTNISNRQLPSDHQIRLRLLNRLGIHQKKPPISAASEHRRKHALHGSGGSSGTSMPAIRKAQAYFCLPLKDDNDDDMPGSLSSPGSVSPSSPSTAAMAPYTMSLDTHEKHDVPFEMQEGPDISNNNNPSTPPRRRIQFNSNVMVVPIPSRHAYSKRIKQAFWMDGAEIQATAERNRYEFASEGWDYQQVLEDEDMYMDVATGQLVHPCWVEDEEEGDEGDCETSNDQRDHESTEETTDHEELYLDAETPYLKRTMSGVFELKDVESGNDEDETSTDDAAATT